MINLGSPDSTDIPDVKRYLDEIFKMKGYDKLLDKVRKDEMCLFPIELIGIIIDNTNMNEFGYLMFCH